jgi:nitrogen fixation protein NifB
MPLEDMISRIRVLIEGGVNLKNVVVSGPGEPLANAAVYAILRRINWEYPDVVLGMATNGLLLRDRVEQVVAAGVRRVSIRIHAFFPSTAKKVYSRILYKGRRYQAEDGAEFLLRNQWEGLMLAVDAGLRVSLNTLFIPGVNDDEIVSIAAKARRLGAKEMELLSLLPGGEPGPGSQAREQSLTAAREACMQYLPQSALLSGAGK